MIPRPDTEFSLSNLTESGGTATVTTSNDHNYEVDDEVTITGTSNYNGTYTVTAVPASNKFEFSISGSPADEGSGTAFLEAKGLIRTNAIDGEDSHSLSGYGVIVGGVVYGNLLPVSLSDTHKSELQSHGTGFVFETYEDDR